MQELMAYDEWVEADIRSTLRVLLRQGQRRFGAPDAATEAELTSIKDMDRLDRFTDAMLTVKSWDELLSTP